jgi:hypothetical protein
VPKDSRIVAKSELSTLPESSRSEGHPVEAPAQTGPRDKSAKVNAMVASADMRSGIARCIKALGCSDSTKQNSFHSNAPCA